MEKMLQASIDGKINQELLGTINYWESYIKIR
jgi:hypothetical protein